MRVLHVWPRFGSSLTNGSEYYAYQLTKKLVDLGIVVDVYTTRTNSFRPLAQFALHWLNTSQLENEKTDGIQIRRFPVTYSPPQIVAYLFSNLVSKRWQSESRFLERVQQDSHSLETFYYERAIRRPKYYDWLFLLGIGPWSWSLWRNLERNLSNYDIVMVGFMPFALIWQVVTIAIRLDKPVVLLPLFHPDDVFHHHQIFYECFARATAILAQTTYSVEQFRRLAPTSNPVLIGAGINVEEFSQNLINGDRFRAKHGLRGKRLVLMVGRKEHSKRYDLAVKAINALADHQVTLVLIGEDVDCQPINSTYVTYLGKVARTELLDAYAACDLLLFPSEHESFGIVILEAWMFRKPVLCNARCLPVASLITHGVDGFVCNGVESFVYYLRQLLDDNDLRERLGEMGYLKTIRHYTWDIIGHRVASLYRQLTRME